MGPHLCQTNAAAVLDFSFPNLYEKQNSEQKFKNEDPISDLSFFRLNWSENLEPEFQGDLLASAHWFRLVGLPNGRGLKWWEASGMCMHHAQHIGCVFMAYKYPLIYTRLAYLVQVGLKVPGFLHHHVPMYQQQEVAALCLKDGHILALPLQQPERQAFSVGSFWHNWWRQGAMYMNINLRICYIYIHIIYIFTCTSWCFNPTRKTSSLKLTR